MKNDVIVVGAGAAGLMAARELGKAGKKVLILEARDRVGGRIYPLSTNEWGYEAQGGAEFMHGDAQVSQELFKAAGITLTNGTEWWNVLDGEPRINEKVSAHDPVLEDALAKLEKDTTVEQFFNTHFSDPKYDAMRKLTYRRVEGYSAGDPALASAFALRDELTEETGWKQASLKEGYSKLLRFLEQECARLGVTILLNKRVTHIQWDADGVHLTTHDGSNFQAMRTMVTVPLPIIQEIAFTPEIPEKKAAAAKIGFGPVIKVLLRFNNKWWSGALEQNFERMFFMFSYEKIPTWWTQYPAAYLTLTGWLAGPKAQVLAEHTDAEITTIALESLSKIFKVPVDTLKSSLLCSKVINWFKDPYAKGAYSYATPGSEAAISELRKPIDQKVYFAGEGVYQGDLGGTVEAALVSGKEVAEEIIKS